jgi:MSHA biogenesis protein MshP
VSRLRQRGFALMLAIFLIITLAAIGLYLVTSSTAQNAAVVQDEQAAHAYQAARTGLEVAAYQLLRPVTANCVPNQTLTLELLGTNNQVYADVACTLVATETEGGATINVYRVTSTGCNATPCIPASPAATYVERQLTITINRSS